MSSSPTDLPESLETAGIFRVLDPEHRALLFAAGKTRSLVPNAVLVEQGSHMDSLFVLLSGVLTVTCHSPVSSVVMGTIKAGECVGEMNALDPLKASATVKVQHTARVWFISRDDLEKFFTEYPSAGVAILKEIAILLTRRIRRNADKLIRQAEMAVATYEWDE